MVVYKTWIVNSGRNARPTHQAMEGETVPVNSTFSNGMMFPGDSPDAAEVANCTCTIAIEGTSVRAGRSYADPSIDDVLKNGELFEGSPIGTGINNPRWGSTDRGIQVVIKPATPAERTAEIAAQAINDRFGFDVLIPRMAERGQKVVSAVARNAKVGEDVLRAAGDLNTTPLKDLMRKAVPLEERQKMSLWDTVIGNYDRHYGNWLIDKGQVVAIDHSLSFGDFLDDWWALTAEEAVLSSAQRTVLANMLRHWDEVEKILVDVNLSKVLLMKRRVERILDENSWWSLIENSLSHGVG